MKFKVTATEEKLMNDNPCNVTGMTVNRLFVLCKKLREQGKGDCGILLSRDNEGNPGIHHCLYDFTIDENLKSLLEDDGGYQLNKDVKKNPQNYVLLG